MRNKLFIILLSMIAIWGFISVDGDDVKAATISEIDESRKYDITNDGIGDDIEISKFDDGMYIFNFSIFVNDRVVYTASDIEALNVNANYIYVNSDESYINVYGTWNNSICTFSYLLKYESGKLKKINSFSFGTHDIKIISMTSKTMIVKSKAQPCSIGYVTYWAKYKKKNHKWVKTSNVYNVKECLAGEGHKKFKTKRGITLYKKSTCRGKGYHIRKGKKCKLLKIKVKNKNNYYGYFKCGRKKGWINIGSMDNYEIFKNVYLAG